MSEIDIQKYFHFMRDDYGTVYGIQEIGDVRELIKDIRQQNEQLKRLQADNEAYKNSIIANHDRAIGKRLEEVLEENEELKAKFNNNSLCNKIQICEADEARMRKALEEIRKYIQSLNKDICNNCGWHNTDGCSPNGYICHDLIEIQNKISEVLK